MTLLWYDIYIKRRPFFLHSIAFWIFGTRSACIMYIYIYYPFQKKQYFTVAIDTNFNIYWQASQFIRLFNLNKHVKIVLYKHLSRDERFKRFKDVTNSGNCNNYALTTDQVLRLIDSIRPKHQDSRFEAWFNSVIEGRQILYPKNPRDYVRLSNNPFQQKGFAALCIDLNRDSVPATVPEGSPVAAKEEESVVDVEGTNEAETYPNPPSCSSVYSEVHHSPPPPPQSQKKIPIDQEYLFTLPVYIRHLKSNFGVFSSMIPRMHPVSTNNEEQVPSFSEPDNSQSSTAPEEFSTSTEQDAASEKNEESDSFPLEVDESKSFVTTDPAFKKIYKFYAVKLNFMSGIRHPTITPFYLSDENNVSYLYVPVKKSC